MENKKIADATHNITAYRIQMEKGNILQVIYNYFLLLQLDRNYDIIEYICYIKMSLVKIVCKHYTVTQVKCTVIYDRTLCIQGLQ